MSGQQIKVIYWATIFKIHCLEIERTHMMAKKCIFCDAYVVTFTFC